MTAVSLLESVAQHESELMAQVAAAEEEGRALVEEAHAEAAALKQQEQARLEADIQGMRREAREARAREEAGIVRRAEEKVAEIRAAASSGREAVRQEILGHLIPAKSVEETA